MILCRYPWLQAAPKSVVLYPICYAITPLQASIGIHACMNPAFQDRTGMTEIAKLSADVFVRKHARSVSQKLQHFCRLFNVLYRPRNVLYLLVSVGGVEF